MIASRSGAVGMLVLVVAVGCGRERARDRDRDRDRDRSTVSRQEPGERDQVGVTTLTGASWVANESAIDRIVASRCAREVTCSNIGPDRPFTSGEVCVREVRKKLSEDLHPDECPTGIDGKELEECLSAIRNESCTNPIEAIARLAACRTGELCMRSEMPHR